MNVVVALVALAGVAFSTLWAGGLPASERRAIQDELAIYKALAEAHTAMLDAGITSPDLKDHIDARIAQYLDHKREPPRGLVIWGSVVMALSGLALALTLKGSEKLRHDIDWIPLLAWVSVGGLIVGYGMILRWYFERDWSRYLGGRRGQGRPPAARRP